jgi:hypothetical protein
MELTSQPPPSPLDSIMLLFLNYLTAQSNGFAPGIQSKSAAEQIDVSDALIDAVFISARTRGLIAPDFNARGRTRWIVSAKGLRFLELHSATVPGASSSGA